MRGYRDLAPEMRRGVGRAVAEKVDRKELRSASMLSLCPGAFDGFYAYKPPPEPPAGMKLIDPGGRLRGATEVDEATARARCLGTPQRVLSVVVSEGGAGAQAYGSVPVKVVVPGYQPGAEAYYLGGT